MKYSPFLFAVTHVPVLSVFTHPPLIRVDGVPSLGWHDTVAFLSIPVFLTFSQIVSMNLMQPKSDDPQQQQANVILKVLPFMVGWFALNVPAALGVYWVVNNVVTTASTLYVRSIMPKIEPVSGGSGSAAAATSVTESTRFNPTPMNERAAGFGRASSDSGEIMKTITPIDAEIVEDFDDGVDENMGPDVPAAPTGKVRHDHNLLIFYLVTSFQAWQLTAFYSIQRGKKKKRRKD